MKTESIKQQYSKQRKIIMNATSQILLLQRKCKHNKLEDRFCTSCNKYIPYSYRRYNLASGYERL